jgi:hypothetical protein
MRDRDESTPAPIPRIDPEAFEESEGFRETLLFRYTEPQANETLRRLGGLLFDLSLNHAEDWPHHPQGETRAELSAALADLRHLEGFLAAVGREHEISSLSDVDNALSIFAGEQAGDLARIADEIERALGEMGK